MAEPTVNNDELNIEQENANPVDESAKSDVSSEETKVWSDKYPKWQKSISKEYWGNDRLASYDSLNSVIQDVLNPKSKAPDTSDEYEVTVSDEGFNKSLAEKFKSADVSKDDAKAISELIASKITKRPDEESLKEYVGLADYEVEKAYVEKAVNTICKDNAELKEMLSKTDSMYDPAVFSVLKIVGKNLGEGNIESFKNESIPSAKADVWESWVSKPKDYNPYTK